jgi:hypothetical protein
MFRLSLLIVVAFCVAFTAVGVCAQDAGHRQRELVAALDKTKYKKKEKANVSIEVYVNIKNEAAVRDPFEYGGNYEGEEGQYRLTLNVERGGAASGSGYDTINGERRASFNLRDARIDGALLTATKVYENGETQRFEAVFVNRTVANGKNENAIDTRDTRFGLGFIQTGNWADKEGRTMNWTSRVFLERR